jgi:hypothetical protein
MIFVDEFVPWDHLGRHIGCRLFANPFVEDPESTAELHAVAAKLGLSREPHFLNGCYPLVKARRSMAIEAGAIDIAENSIYRFVGEEHPGGGR